VAFREEVAFQGTVASALVSSVCVTWWQVHLVLCVSSVSADCLGCHWYKEGICPFDFDEALPGVLLLPPSPFYALETQHPVSSLLRLRCEVSSSDTVFPLLQPVKTCLWPFWAYLMPGTCRTDPAVPDLLALP